MSSKRQQKYRRDLLEQDFSRLDSKIARENFKKTLRYKMIKADSDLRKQIQDKIKQMAEDGKVKLEILTYLINVYPYPEYIKYYGAWIDNKFKQLKIEEKCDEERENE